MGRFLTSTAIIRLLAVLALVAACSALLALPILLIGDGGWYASSQSYRYPFLLGMFKEQLLAGQWYPRWLPRLMGGYGYPTFVFYPPGFWFFALPFDLLLHAPLLSCKIALTLLLMLFGTGVYRLARLYGGPIAATLTTLIAYLTPSLVFALFKRGDFSEAASVALCPWVLFALFKMLREMEQGRPAFASAVLCALCLAAVVFTHPMTAAWLALTLLLLVLAQLAASHRRRPLFAASAAVAALAAALSAAYWYPALALQDTVDFGTSMSGFAHQSLSAGELFGVQSPYLGILQPALALAGFYFGLRSRLILAVMGCYIAGALYISPLSLPLREAIEPLKYLQHPSRVIPVMVTLQAIGAALLFGALEKRMDRRDLLKAGAFVIAALAFAASGNYRIYNIFSFEQFVFSRAQMFEDMTHSHEFRPRKADTKGLNPRIRQPELRLAYIESGIPVIANSNRADSDFQLWAAPVKPAEIIVNQFYFPGWKVEINGALAQECPEKAAQAPKKPSFCAGPNGRILIRLGEGGEKKIHVWYDGAPFAQERNALAALAALLSLGALWCMRPRRPQAGEPA